MALAERNGRFLFEIRPDLFPEGRLTDLEMELWGDYLEEQQERRKHNG